MKGYKTGAPEPCRESTQESRAIGWVIGKLELSRMFDLCELSRQFHADRWAKEADEIELMREER